MPLPTPQLDDRSFAELVATLRDQIPGYSRAWTDFNASDAGIMLLELWCWLAEMILYRMNQIPPRSETNFFKLILDPPEPVTAEVTLKLRPQISDSPLTTIPAGTRFATQLLSPPELPPEVEAALGKRPVNLRDLSARIYSGGFAQFPSGFFSRSACLSTGSDTGEFFRTEQSVGRR